VRKGANTECPLKFIRIRKNLSSILGLQNAMDDKKGI
jgi:hypothetical protein